jgi:hypothetical protein
MYICIIQTNYTINNEKIQICTRKKYVRRLL